MRTKKLKNIFFEYLNNLYNPWNLLILIILLVAFVLRIYRVGEILDFHYDQGRDAMVIWKLWHEKKMFLIGPTTGIEGVFLGPFYYYLIAPFYKNRKGNPAIPSIFLSFLVTVSLYFLYKTGELLGDKKLGLIALLIGSFSSALVFSSRWLSNPTPIYLTSILIFYLLAKIIKEYKNYYWYLIALFVGVSMHFESASAIFYIPVILAFTIWQRKYMNLKLFAISLVIFITTFLPQLIFNFKHDNILINNILTEIPKFEENNPSILNIISGRLDAFWNIFSSKIFLNNNKLSIGFSLISLSGLIILGLKKKNNDVMKLFSIFIGIPAICYIIYRGNHGVLYDYYLTGYYLILVLLFSTGLYSLLKYKIGKVCVSVFIVTFLFINIKSIYQRLNVNVYSGNNIFISNQIQAIQWIYNDARNESFNVDVYVPPVIPHSYDYLFTYVGDKRSTNTVKRLYTLYEVDPTHPERLEAWLNRQKGIGKIMYEDRIGGIVVQRRERIK